MERCNLVGRKLPIWWSGPKSHTLDKSLDFGHDFQEAASALSAGRCSENSSFNAQLKLSILEEEEWSNNKHALPALLVMELLVYI